MITYTTFFKLTTPPRKWHFLEYLPDLKIVKNQQNYTCSYKGNIIHTKPLREFSTLFSQKQVFLIGSGPSIKEQNLTLIKDKTNILLNGAISLIDSHRIQPSAILITDKGFVKRHHELINRIPDYTPCFLSAGAMKECLNINSDFFKSRPVIILEKATKPINKSAIKPHQLDNDGFIKNATVALSLDLEKGFAEAGTVMYVAAQLCLYFKAAHITLVGFDLGNANEPRFYETTQNQDKSGLIKALSNRIIPAFSLLKTVCDTSNVIIDNASHLSHMPYTIIPFNDCLMPTTDKTS